MVEIIDFKKKKVEQEELNSKLTQYIADNSITLCNKDNPDFAISVILEVDDNHIITIDDLIDPYDNILVNIIIANIMNHEIEPASHLIYRPRWGDVLNYVAQYLQSQGIEDTVAMVFDLEALDDEEEHGNSFLVYYYDSGGKEEEPEE
ncbi:MAG: hypothetical protein PHG08_01145 [Bacilli bacterium]|nr:hypothetical protein [Bacilli bacterium]